MIDILIYILALVLDLSFITNLFYGFSLAIPLGIAILVKNRDSNNIIWWAVGLGLIVELLVSVQIGVMVLGFVFSILIMKLVFSLINLSDFRWASIESWLGYYVVSLVMISSLYLISGLADSYISSKTLMVQGFSWVIFIEALTGIIWLGLIKKNVV